MNRSAELIMPQDLRIRILMSENRQQVEQCEALRLCPRVCRATLLIQSAFITNSNAMPVETPDMRAGFRYRSAMMQFPVAGDVKVIPNIVEPSLQMALPDLLHSEGDIAARRAAMNHQQPNLTREIAIFWIFHIGRQEVNVPCRMLRRWPR